MSDKIDTGGSAFPVPNDARVNNEPGMTLRDWFAGQALSAGMTPSEAYAAADAMLKARNNQTGKAA